MGGPSSVPGSGVDLGYSTLVMMLDGRIVANQPVKVEVSVKVGAVVSMVSPWLPIMIKLLALLVAGVGQRKVASLPYADWTVKVESSMMELRTLLSMALLLRSWIRSYSSPQGVYALAYKFRPILMA